MSLHPPLVSKKMGGLWTTELEGPKQSGQAGKKENSQREMGLHCLLKNIWREKESFIFWGIVKYGWDSCIFWIKNDSNLVEILTSPKGGGMGASRGAPGWFPAAFFHPNDECRTTEPHFHRDTHIYMYIKIHNHAYPPRDFLTYQLRSNKDPWQLAKGKFTWKYTWSAQTGPSGILWWQRLAGKNLLTIHD